MNLTTHYQIALSLLNGIGPSKAKQILESLDSLEELFLLSDRDLHIASGLPRRIINRMERKQALDIAEIVIENSKRAQVRPIFYTDPEFPRRLRHCTDPPLVLYVKGQGDLNPERSVAIVGTRMSTEYGELICEELVQTLSEANVDIISGLAYGIDTFAHRASVRNQNPTIAVLGNGLDRIYPYTNAQLSREIMHQGALVSEFVVGTPPDRENFPQRNRVVAGMSDAVIVVESKESGGSLITAKLAMDYTRDVFAFPGDIRSEASKGCNTLIQNDGAHLVNSGLDILKFMGWNRPILESIQRKAFSSLNPVQQEILSMIEPMGTHIDHLSARSNKPISLLNSELLFLELEGLIRPLPGNRYVAV